jgi:multidrug transporter EmrE-like cation transporter
MPNGNGYMSFLYGTYMATLDVFMLGIIKAISTNTLEKIYMILPTAIYALQPWLFLRSLKYESMTIMNLMWDVMSDILVTGTGVFFFKEKISRTKMIGIGFAILAVIFMNCNEFCD